VKNELYIIAGCNGAGKTTASFTILPVILDCKEFVNADEIAKGLSPFQPEKVAFEAGHHIETDVIKRRYKNGIKNLFEIYLPIVDEAMIFDNSAGKHELIAEKTAHSDMAVVNTEKFKQLKHHYDENV
jgi:predicted ABC-type ATPase